MKYINGIYPAIVTEYDSASRTCRVSIPGIADQGDVMPIAEICYPIGDRSTAINGATEIAISPGDKVWVSFISNDCRYPIIVGYRNPTTGNSTGTRAFSHANIALTANNLVTLTATTLNINANVNITGTLTNNGHDVGSGHKHTGGTIGGNTGAPL